jgi:hypothetical protein
MSFTGQSEANCAHPEPKACISLEQSELLRAAVTAESESGGPE